MQNYNPESDAVKYVYFISFIIISQFILLNILALVVIEQFEQFYFKSHLPLEVIEEMVPVFNEV